MAKPASNRYRLIRAAIFSASVLSFIPLVGFVKEHSANADQVAPDVPITPTPLPRLSLPNLNRNQVPQTQPAQTQPVQPLPRVHTRSRAS